MNSVGVKIKIIPLLHNIMDHNSRRRTHKNAHYRHNSVFNHAPEQNNMTNAESMLWESRFEKIDNKLENLNHKFDLCLQHFDMLNTKMSTLVQLQQINSDMMKNQSNIPLYENRKDNSSKNRKDILPTYKLTSDQASSTPGPKQPSLQSHQCCGKSTHGVPFTDDKTATMEPPMIFKMDGGKGKKNDGFLNFLGSIFGAPPKKVTQTDCFEDEDVYDFDITEDIEDVQELNIPLDTINDLIFIGEGFDRVKAKYGTGENSSMELDLEKALLEEMEKVQHKIPLESTSLDASYDCSIPLHSMPLDDKVDDKIDDVDKFTCEFLKKLTADIEQASIRHDAKLGEPIIIEKTINIDDMVKPPSQTNDNKPKLESQFFSYFGKRYSLNLQILSNLVKPLKKLRSLIGMKNIKSAMVDMILYYIQGFESKNRNMLHTKIEGPPGVGKTEVGKIMAQIYAAMGIIPSTKFKMVKRTDLIGEYVGHTAIKTQNAIDEAEGGVLFIDEAYSLGNSEKKDTFSKECIDTINQNLSENKKRLIVIIAGYPGELQECFFAYNRGLERRFPFTFSVEKYSHEELRDIFIKKVNDIKWNVSDVDTEVLTKFFSDNYDSFKYFGGDIENFLLNCKYVHSRRVAGKHPRFRRHFNTKDLQNGLDRFVTNRKKKEEEMQENIRVMYI